MPLNEFQKVRAAVTSNFYDCGFLTPIEDSDLPWIIEESNNLSEPNKLERISVSNILVGEEDFPRSWYVNLELKRTMISSVDGFKMTEGAIILFTSCKVHIILIELKTTLTPESAIIQKIKNSISRIHLALSTFEFLGAMYEDIQIEFRVVLAYNNINKMWAGNGQLVHSQFASILNAGSGHMFLYDDFGKENRVSFFLCQNQTGNSAEFDIDFETFFTQDDYDLYPDNEDPIVCP